MSKVRSFFRKVFLSRLGFPITLLLVLILFAALGIYTIRNRPEILGLSKGPAQLQSETESLVFEVGKLIELPADEKPTVATVSDADKLKEQQFFKNAKNGDKILVYTNGRRAILYRPSEHRIVEVGAVNIQGQEEVGAAQEVIPSTTFKIVVLNGAGVPTLSSIVQEEIATELDSAEVMQRTASRGDYPDTMVVDLAGNRAADAQNLADILNSDVGKLPSNETVPEGSDFVVLIGRDRAPQPTPVQLVTPSPTP